MTRYNNVLLVVLDGELVDGYMVFVIADGGRSYIPHAVTNGDVGG